MSAAMSSEGRARSNDEIYDLLDRSTRLLEQAAQDISTRATKSEFDRLEEAVRELTTVIRHEKDGLVMRVDRLERVKPFDPESFRRELLEEIAKQRAEAIANAQKLTPKQIWQLVGAIATAIGGLLWVIETRFFGSIG